MKKLLFTIIFFFTIVSCKDETPKPFYEVVPVVEVQNIFFNDVDAIRLNINLSVDGDSTITSWDIPFKGVRYGCTLLKWTGDPVEYIAGTELKMNVSVFYKLNGNGFILLNNLSDNNLIKQATWVRVYFEVRDRNNPSDKYVGIEQYNNPTEDVWQAPSVFWLVGDFNGFPPQETPVNGRIASISPVICEECIWTQIK